MNQRDVVLFDLDGTLTPPRKKITRENFLALKTLSRFADVGIVTGSGISYVKEQLEGNDDFIVLDVLPCNGTQRWFLSANSWTEMDPGPNMKSKLGQLNYNKLLLEIDQHQRYTMMSYDLPYTGTFLSYRRSLLNWCPIGRDANDLERGDFEKFDAKNSWRKGILQSLSSRLKTSFGESLTIKLGGSTSFDIYPDGWDKTYALNHYKERNVWFVGDRTGPGGNDQEIYEALLPSGRAFSVASQNETPKVIETIIERIYKSSKH